ncbi:MULTISPECIES: hypothetical protein [unclassified Coleofasciculus]|uniref:hypothetical protein n=1 Tax=Cyanophyceae TaxID=3028117 RepID=UPI00168615DB|nr:MULTISPECIES: hypothetical protein [unclassified Coleofasciculus]MBD1880271.1 hypothetical protein [Coleofasciculus sp. FACHB-T130]MBD1944325.1 hypothetical protein [Coleofasciculus sp. FACHB-712]
MKQEKRFTRNVWGVQLHFKQAIKSRKYFEAECWLNRMQHSSDSQASVKEGDATVERLKFVVKRFS